MSTSLKRIKKKEHENLSDSNIAKVIDLLEREKPITKKDACEILNISYNTTRLNTILENWKAEKENAIKRRKEKRGKPASEGEVQTIVESFLTGTPIQDIAKRTYRSTLFIKNILDRIGVPERVTGDDKYKVSILPEECISEDFEVGEIAWSATYHSACEIRSILEIEKYNKLYNTKCYRVYVMDGEGGYNAFVPSYDLGKLTHIQKLGVNLNRI